MTKNERQKTAKNASPQGAAIEASGAAAHKARETAELDNEMHEEWQVAKAWQKRPGAEKKAHAAEAASSQEQPRYPQRVLAGEMRSSNLAEIALC